MGLIVYIFTLLLNIHFDISYLIFIPLYIMLCPIVLLLFPYIINKVLPSMPKCSCGKCNLAKDYTNIKINEDEEYVYTCQCGRKYLKRNRRQVDEILQDGTIISYMKWKGLLRKWQLDN